MFLPCHLFKRPRRIDNKAQPCVDFQQDNLLPTEGGSHCQQYVNHRALGLEESNPRRIRVDRRRLEPVDTVDAIHDNWCRDLLRAILLDLCAGPPPTSQSSMCLWRWPQMVGGPRGSAPCSFLELSPSPPCSGSGPPMRSMNLGFTTSYIKFPQSTPLLISRWYRHCHAPLLISSCVRLGW